MTKYWKELELEAHTMLMKQVGTEKYGAIVSPLIDVLGEGGEGLTNDTIDAFASRVVATAEQQNLPELLFLADVLLKQYTLKRPSSLDN